MLITKIKIKKMSSDLDRVGVILAISEKGKYLR
jgi:hypothetical protein